VRPDDVAEGTGKLSAGCFAQNNQSTAKASSLSYYLVALRMLVSYSKYGAEGGNRTRTVLADRGILSPLRGFITLGLAPFTQT
jgi:hypothetical protein